MKIEEHGTYSINGTTVARIRYGEREDDWGVIDGPCGDCGATQGKLHDPGCDVERCPNCSGQAISCSCDYGNENPLGIKDARQVMA